MTEIWERIKSSVAGIVGRNSPDIDVMEQVERMPAEEMEAFSRKYLEGDQEARKQEKLFQAIAVWRAKQ